MDKKILRNQYKLIRKEVKDVDIKVDRIYHNILSDIKYQSSHIIALFVGFKDEVKTEKLIERMLDDGKTICLPYISGKEMTFHKISSLDELITNHMGIKEPPCTNELMKANMIDLMYVPGLCFDYHGYRVGYGGGYYDRYLKDSDIYTVGIGYHEQFLADELIDIDDYDIRLKAFISDEIVKVYK